MLFGISTPGGGDGWRCSSEPCLNDPTPKGWLRRVPKGSRSHAHRSRRGPCTRRRVFDGSALHEHEHSRTGHLLHRLEV
jgi:hypothetical protein